MNPKKIIESTTKADLAKASGKRQDHSTRDYPRFLKKLEFITETFKNLGYKVTVEKIVKSKPKQN